MWWGMQRLISWNPLDQARLLVWLFLHPQAFVAYEQGTHEGKRIAVGAWLASTLTWLPLFIAALGHALGTVPNSDWWWWVIVAVILFGWAITGWIGAVESSRENLLAGFVAFIIALPIVLAITDRLLASLFIISAGVIARGVAVVAALGRTSGISGGVGTGLAVSLAIVIAGGIAAGAQLIVGAVVVVGGAYLLGKSVANTIRKNRETGRASWQGKLIFGALLLSYLTLIWLYLLGGWYVLFEVVQS